MRHQEPLLGEVGLHATREVGTLILSNHLLDLLPKAYKVGTGSRLERLPAWRQGHDVVNCLLGIYQSANT